MPQNPRAVVITGASSGIGAAFARALAARGDNVVLVARREDALAALAAQLRERHGVHAVCVPADLSDPAAVAALPERIAQHELSVSGLINSAGFGTAGPFVSEDLARVLDEIQVNISALTALTHALLPQLVAARGILVQVSSNASHQPLPGLAVYAATKAYVTSFTESLWKETQGTGLSVLALCPGPTDTEFFAAAGSEDFKVGAVAPVEDVVNAALRHLDRARAAPVLTVGFANRVQGVVARIAPRRLRLAVAARLVSEDSA